MPERDSPAIHIDPFPIELERLLDSQILRSERLIDFYEIHVR